MKIAIVGSRSYADADFVFRRLDLFIEDEQLDSRETTIISGGATGADSIAKRYAQEWGIEFKELEPKWKNLKETPNNPVKLVANQKGIYNALAGLNRNTKIVNESDVIFAFYKDKKTPGTMDSVKKARQKGIDVYEFINREKI